MLPDGLVMFIGGFGLSKNIGIPPRTEIFDPEMRDSTRGADRQNGAHYQAAERWPNCDDRWLNRQRPCEVY